MALISLTGLPAARSGVRPMSVEVAKPAAADTKTAKVLDALTKFIPTELLAPYVAALSLAESQHWNSIKIYIVFVIATPLVYLLFEFARLAMESRSAPSIPVLIWRAIAATIAFAVWGLAAPTNGLQDTIGGPAVAGFLATLVVSPLLTGADAIILHKLGIKPNG